MVACSFICSCNPKTQLLFWVETCQLSPCQLWMCALDVAWLVPPAPSWALTSCGEKHEPCRGLVIHTRACTNMHRTVCPERWGGGWVRGCKHVVYQWVMFCRNWVLFSFCSGLKLASRKLQLKVIEIILQQTGSFSLNCGRSKLKYFHRRNSRWSDESAGEAAVEKKFVPHRE